MAVIGVLAIQGDFEAHSKSLERLGQPWRFVKKISDFDGLSGLIIPGGESTTFLKILEGEGLTCAIRDFAASHAVFGTCAGAILMAEKVENPPQPSLGLMHITVRRNAYGRQLSSSVRTIELENGLNNGATDDTPLEALLIRAPIILGLGPKVQTLARLDGNPVLVREGCLLAGTFHPELTADTRVHRYFCYIAATANGCYSGSNDSCSK